MALVAGLNFTFAVAVMPNLAGADDRTFVATTQRFNQNPVFPISFTVALVLTVIAVLMQRGRGLGAAMHWTIVALVLYGIVLFLHGQGAADRPSRASSGGSASSWPPASTWPGEDVRS
ncbi:hypothetical protein [Luteipulveratus mongoliensis]|uniref:hypothetical protein n=1 Tax=Luteipulveratus mongoliensis TaxID=571913 RepID=UPI0006982D6A|nr:hypothetical protein [Luteipulveratus mongoliensis]